MPSKKDETLKDWLKAIAIGLGIAAGASYVATSAKKEPPHARFAFKESSEIKQIFLMEGFISLSIFNEVKKFNQLWGVAKKIDEDRELHVRAIKDQPDSFFLSGHVEIKRESLQHLLGKSDYDQGKKYLIAFLKEQGLRKRQLDD